MISRLRKELWLAYFFDHSASRMKLYRRMMDNTTWYDTTATGEWVVGIHGVSFFGKSWGRAIAKAYCWKYEMVSPGLIMGVILGWMAGVGGPIVWRLLTR